MCMIYMDLIYNVKTIHGRYMIITNGYLTVAMAVFLCSKTSVPMSRPMVLKHHSNPYDIYLC